MRFMYGLLTLVLMESTFAISLVAALTYKLQL